jgi:hypothetical protein
MNTGRTGVKHEGENNDEVRVDGASGHLRTGKPLMFASKNGSTIPKFTTLMGDVNHEHVAGS